MVDSAVVALPEVAEADLPAESWDEWLLARMGSALDSTMLLAMRFVIDAVMMPRPEDLPELRRSATPFLNGGLWKEPRRFFSFVDEPVAPVAARGRLRRSIDGGVVFAREFSTGYEPYPGMAKFIGAKTRQPDRVLVEHWVHEPKRPRGTVVALHGFSMGYPRIDSFALFAWHCFQEGFDVALLTLPFHGSRTPSDARFSGERFAVPHVARLNDAVRQAIYEVHTVVGWLREQTGAPVGLLGLSLGGYLAALMAGLTPRLDFVISMVPPVCLGDLAWRFFSQSRYHDAESPAFSREELRVAYRIHSPLTYPRQIDKARLLVLAGRGDQIVPRDHPHTLWRHWGKPNICWFAGSHLAPFRRGHMFATIAEHLERCVERAG